MSPNLAEIRSNDEYSGLYEIATRLRNQKLLIDAEQNSLINHTKDVSENEKKLLTYAWQSSYWRIIFKQLKSQSEPLDPTMTCRLLKIIDETTALPAYKVFGRHFSYIDQLLTMFYNEPLTIATLLDNIDENDASANDAAIQVFFHMIYSSGMYAEDELRFADLVCELLRKQLAMAKTKMRMMLRKETSISTRFYKLFVESSHPTMVYLTAALRKGVLTVIQLGNFWLDIDEKQSSTRFLRDNKQNQQRLPEYRALVVSKLVELVDIFLEDIFAALPILPPSLNWIIRNLYQMLYDVLDDISAIELSHACKDMIVSNLLCPAIISPQKFGIVDNDVRIGTIVNHNLVQVAMVIQMISLREFETPPAEYGDFLVQCRKTHLISEMMDILLIEKAATEVDILAILTSGEVKSDKMMKTCFVASMGDVNTLLNIARHPKNESDESLERITKIVKRLPESFTAAVNPTSNETEVSPRMSTLRNFQRKVLTLKKTDSSASELDSKFFENMDCVYFEKESFELFYLEISLDNYREHERHPVEKPVEIKHACFTIADSETKDENDELPDEILPEILPSITIPVRIVDEETAISRSAPINLLETEIPTSNETTEKRAESVSPDPAFVTDSTENLRGFAKLKNLGGRVKRGLTQSNTLSDIRVHLRRSTSLAKPEGSMVASSSENAIASTARPSGPRDDILEKYASKSSVNKTEISIFDNLIDFGGKVQNEEDVEPYYSKENLTTCRAFKDTLRKLTTVLGSVSYLPHINSRATRNENGEHDKKVILDRFLAGLLVEADHQRDYGLAAQLREVKRCIELFENDGVVVLLDHLAQEDLKRDQEILKLREQRITLMRTTNDIATLEQRVALNQRLTEQNLVDALMRIFIENGFVTQRAANNRSAEVVAVLKFYDEFKLYQATDERAELLNKLLQFLKDRLLNNQDWNYATESMVSRAMTSIERFVMFAVYETAFHPNLGADQHRDKVLRASIAKVAATVTPNYLNIPQRLHGEAPWPSAQAEIAMLDVYVTAHDKLSCVVRCCDVINNLIALSSKNAVASADDLTPVLVFVLIKANPRSLLSNVQFVETYAGNKIETGRDAYYWTNFKSAVEYIKTIL